MRLSRHKRWDHRAGDIGWPIVVIGVDGLEQHNRKDQDNHNRDRVECVGPYAIAHIGGLVGALVGLVEVVIA